MNSFFSLTPKAERVQELRAQGLKFDYALSIADEEFSSDGMKSVRRLEPAKSFFSSVASLKAFVRQQRRAS